jgi:rRNA maturation RNase YbeY
MSHRLIVRDRTGLGQVDTRSLRRVLKGLVEDLLAVPVLELGVYLVRPAEITRLNEAFVKHPGATDVITFDYAEPFGGASYTSPASRRACGRRATPPSHRSSSGEPACDQPKALHGEICICLEVAFAQSKRFRVSWQSELLRCVVHGVLHLLGYDDQQPAARRGMKREEDRLLRELRRHYDFGQLARRRSYPAQLRPPV